MDSAHLVCTRNAFKMFFTFSGVIITEKLSTKNFRRRGRGNGITNYSTFNFEPQFFHLCLAFFFKSLFVVCNLNCCNFNGYFENELHTTYRLRHKLKTGFKPINQQPVFSLFQKNKDNFSKAKLLV